jgi:hypothetical protein
LDILFSSILRTCPNQSNPFKLIVSVIVFFLINNIKISIDEAAHLVVCTSTLPRRRLSVWGLSYNLTL